MNSLDKRVWLQCGDQVPDRRLLCGAGGGMGVESGKLCDSVGKSADALDGASSTWMGRLSVQAPSAIAGCGCEQMGPGGPPSSSGAITTFLPCIKGHLPQLLS
jgi:hypothetical protein